MMERLPPTKRSRRQQREHDAVARLVPLEHLALHQRLARAGSDLPPHFFLRLPEREGLGLCEEVREQDTVVLGVGDGVLRGSGRDEVCGDELGPLVDELVEGVLSVGPSRTPDDRLERSGISASL